MRLLLCVTGMQNGCGFNESGHGMFQNVLHVLQAQLYQMPPMLMVSCIMMQMQGECRVYAP